MAKSGRPLCVPATWAHNRYDHCVVCVADHITCSWGASYRKAEAHTARLSKGTGKGKARRVVESDDGEDGDEDYELSVGEGAVVLTPSSVKGGCKFMFDGIELTKSPRRTLVPASPASS